MKSYWNKAFTLILVGLGSSAHCQTAQEILAQTQETWNGIRDYRCQMQSNNRLGQEKDLKKIDFAFKREHQVRMEVLNGKSKGSVLTRNDSGRIKGKKGGILGVVAVTLDETDERIFNLRGRKFYEADWGTVIEEFAGRIRAGWTVEVQGEEEVSGSQCHAIVATGRETGSRISKDIMCVDKQRHLVLRRKQYEGEDLVNEVVWWDIQINPTLSDELFSL
jgi:outer membrane lipoprotein-sorting protein